jgi:hypothetical protein
VQTLAALALVVGVVGAGVLAWAVRRHLRLAPRRRRRRGRRSHDPTADVLAEWRDAQGVLERARLGRRPAETLHEHATRLESLAQGRWLAYSPAVLTIRAARIEAPGTAPDEGDPIAAAVDAYRKLAELATRASYASDPCTTFDAADAEELSMAVRAGLTRPARRGRVPVRA